MKQKPHTDFITALLKKTLGEDADTGALPVFEVVATSARPLRKKGIYSGAVITNVTLAQMAAAVNHEAVPFMQDHNMEGTPKGKFFYAELRQDSGVPELRGLFYLDPSETDLVAKANIGTLDEVSVGFLPSSIKCSACQFDYMKELAAGNYEPFMNLTCDKGHKIGAGGVHAKVDGLETFMELSAVSRGAAPNSKIIGNDNAKLGTNIQKLAASGFDVTELFLTASASEGEQDVDITELVTKLSDTGAELAVLKASVANHDALLTAANDRASTAEARVAELTTELTAAQEANAPSEDAEALNASLDFLKAQYTAVLTASGKTDITVPETAVELIEGIKTNHAALSAVLPIDGVALSIDHKEVDKSNVPARLASFKTKN